MKDYRMKSFTLLAVLLLTSTSLFAQMSTEMIDGLRYQIDAKAKTATLVSNGDEKYSGHVVVPEKVQAKDGVDYPVVAFGEECFIGCEELTGITIPSTVTTLGDRCFMNCPNLEAVDLPSSLTALPVGCFGFCASLTHVEVPSSVKSLGGACFMDCTNLESVTLPATIPTLPDQCFSRCASLKRIDIPSSVTTLGEYCFYRCYNLTEVKIPRAVTTLGGHCFENCSILETVELASTVSLLYDECFSYCYSLKSLYFNGQLPENTINSGVPTDCAFYVPADYLTSYVEALSPTYTRIYTWTPHESEADCIRPTVRGGIVATAHDGVVTVSGLKLGDTVRFYTVNGKLLTTATAVNGQVSCAVGSPFVVARVDGMSVKVAVRN